MMNWCSTKILRVISTAFMFLIFLTVTAGSASAVVILSENFNGTFPPAGWSVPMQWRPGCLAPEQCISGLCATTFKWL